MLGKPVPLTLGCYRRSDAMERRGSSGSAKVAFELCNTRLQCNRVGISPVVDIENFIELSQRFGKRRSAK